MRISQRPAGKTRLHEVAIRDKTGYTCPILLWGGNGDEIVPHLCIGDVIFAGGKSAKVCFSVEASSGRTDQDGLRIANTAVQVQYHGGHAELKYRQSESRLKVCWSAAGSPGDRVHFHRNWAIQSDEAKAILDEVDAAA